MDSVERTRQKCREIFKSSFRQRANGLANYNSIMNGEEFGDRYRYCHLHSVWDRPNCTAQPAELSNVATKTPPPVPPRTPKTITRTITIPQSTDRADPLIGVKQNIMKKVPPPVPKKPSHLQRSDHCLRTIEDRKQTENNGPTTHVRFFALLLSPSVPSKKPEKRADSQRQNIFRSTPHLADISDTSQPPFDDNNNFSSTDGAKNEAHKSSDGKSGTHRSACTIHSPRAARRSLPLLSKSTSVTITVEADQSDENSNGCISLAVGQSSASSSSNAVPLPVPKKECGVSNVQRSIAPISRIRTEESDVDSVVFFSTISTISSHDTPRHHSADVPKRNCDHEPGKSNTTFYKSGEGKAGTCRVPNVLLDAFIVEQSRRTVSIVERNARIIKWLYGCSNR